MCALSIFSGYTHRWLLALLFCPSLVSLAQVPYLVKDHPGQVHVENPNFWTITPLNGNFYMIVPNSNQIWVTDGTLEDARIWQEVATDTANTPENPGVLGNRLFFTAIGWKGARELWQSDGTVAGTGPVGDANGETIGINISSPRVMNNSVYFAGLDRLWRSDLTPAGTVALAETGSISQMTPGATRLYFNGGDRLWWSDGTPQGTEIIYSGAASHMAVMGDDLYFLAPSLPHALLKRSGAGGPVEIVKEIHGTSGDLQPQGLFSLGNRLVLFVDDGIHGMEPWVSDGTQQGTVAVELEPGTTGITFHANTQVVLGNALFFQVSTSQYGRELWVSDGTPGGTLLVIDSEPGPGNGNITTPAGAIGAVFFNAGGMAYQATASGEGAFVLESSPIQPVGEMNGHFHYRVEDQYWRTDGTPGGNEPWALALPLETRSDNYGFLDYANGRALYYQPGELWLTEGWDQVTYQLKSSRISQKATLLGDHVYFTFPSAVGEVPLLRSNLDGTQQSLVTTAYNNGDFAFIDVWDDALYFADQSGLFRMVEDQAPVRLSYYIQTANFDDAVPFGKGFLFPGSVDSSSNTLIFSDGTSQGTRIINRAAGNLSRNPSFLTVLGGEVLYSAWNDSNDQELWKIDSATEVVTLVKNLNPQGSSFPRHLSAIPGMVLFMANDGVHGTELWRSDGTEAGTALVKDILPGPNWGIAGSGEAQSAMVVLDGIAYFPAHDGIHGQELWRSDGTEAGTWLVTDIFPGSRGAAVAWLQVHGGLLYFGADHPDYGYELWSSDGTAAGTQLVADINPQGSSRISNLSPSGDTLYFKAETLPEGNQIWALRQAPINAIYAPQRVCVGQTYEAAVPYQSNEATYVWTIGNGSILNGQGTRTIQFNAAGNGAVTLGVTVVLRGVAAVGNLEVSADQGLPAQPGPIAGPAESCPYLSDLSYSVPLQDDAISYQWSLSDGGLIESGQGTETVRVSLLDRSVTLSVMGINACGESLARTLEITVHQQAGPVFAGEDLVSCETSVQLGATHPLVGEGSWQVLSGVGGVVAEPTNPWSLFQGQPGELYQLEWTVAFGSCPAISDRVFISITEPTPLASAGADQFLCSTETWLEGNSPDWAVGIWSILSGGGGQLDDPNNGQTRFSGQVGETYILEWTLRGKPCDLSSDRVTIHIENNLFWDAGPDQCGFDGDSLYLAAEGRGRGQWSVIDGPHLSPTQFSDPTSPYSAFTPLGGQGDYLLQWQALDCPDSADRLYLSIKGSDVTPQSLGLMEQTPTLEFFPHSELVAWNNRLYFFQDAGFQNGLWVSDGTFANTRLLKAMKADSARFFVGQTLLYFSVDTTLWRTDGTEAGTIPLKSGYSFYGEPVDWQGETWLNSNAGLIRTDGTPAGTRILEVLAYDMTVWGDRLAFRGPQDLWLSDGTPEGTGPLAVAGLTEIHPGMVAYKGLLYFIATSSREVYVSDGTPAGTRPLGISPRNITAMIHHNGYLYITGTSNGISGLWRCDGTVTGTVPILNNVEVRMKPVDDQLFLFSTDRLFATDGTESGTQEVLGDSIDPAQAAGYQGKLYFTYWDSQLGWEPWVSDGTPAGTHMLTDLTPEIDSTLVTWFTSYNNYLWFSVIQGETIGLWRTDGTDAGTQWVGAWPAANGHNLSRFQSAGNRMIIQVGNGSDKYLLSPDSGVSQTSIDNSYTGAGELFYFKRGESVLGQELWASPDDESHQFLVKDINPGTASSSPEQLVTVGDGIFFTAVTAAGRELWYSDGTEPGTVLLKDIEPGPADSQIEGITPFGNGIIFTATTSLNGEEPWISDGTPAGTVLLKELEPGTGFSPVSTLAANDQLAWLAVSTPQAGIWQTDGTQAGTLYVAALPPINSQQKLAIDQVLFLGDSNGRFNAIHGDGRTVDLTFINAGAPLVFNNEMWFIHDQQLYHSDGTLEGTRPFENGVPMTLPETPGISGLRTLAVHGDRLYFSSAGSLGGAELWYTDGTCTYRVEDRMPGAEGPMYLHLLPGQDALFLISGAPANGSEVLLLQNDEVNLTDPTLRALVLAQHDTNANDRLEYAEARAITSLSLPDQGITRYKGIESMTNLSNLLLSGNNATSIYPLAANPNLGRGTADVIDISQNRLGSDSCVDVRRLRDRASLSGALLITDPQQGLFGIPDLDDWPHYTVLELLGGTLLDPAPLACE